jgi:hypothetical protein
VFEIYLLHIAIPSQFAEMASMAWPVNRPVVDVKLGPIAIAPQGFVQRGVRKIGAHLHVNVNIIMQ